MFKKTNYLTTEIVNEVLKDTKECYDKEKSFTPDIIESLSSVFGSVFPKAMTILDTYNYIKYAIKDEIRVLYKISSASEQFTLFDKINFCTCETFSTKVLCNPPQSIYCEHVLALKLAQIVGKIRTESVTNAQMTELLSNQTKEVFKNGEI